MCGELKWLHYFQYIILTESELMWWLLNCEGIIGWDYQGGHSSGNQGIKREVRETIWWKRQGEGIFREIHEKLSKSGISHRENEIVLQTS